MGAYTQSIREILQQNKTTSEDLLNINDINTIAKRALFDRAPVNLISAEHRDNLITGFTLHFFNDEIGLETLPLWKIALNEKLVNNAQYINQIYDNLDKEVFANYSVKNTTEQGTNTSETNGEDNTTNSGTSKQTTEGSTNSKASGSDKTENANTTENTGDTTTVGTGSIERAASGTDKTTAGGTDKTTAGGTDTVKHTGDKTQTNSGNDVTTGTNSSDTANSGYYMDDLNAQNFQFDTPMGSLANMRTPGGDAAGQGVSYAAGQSYNYLTAAAENDQTTKHTDNTATHTEGDNSSTVTHGHIVTDESNLQDATTYGKTDQTEYGKTDQTEYGKKDTETRNNVTDKQTRNLKDTSSGESTTTYGRVDDQTNAQEVNGETASTQERKSKDTTTGSHEGERQETDYTLNWEMLYASMPLLNKVWQIFDDLFMLIY